MPLDLSCSDEEEEEKRGDKRNFSRSDQGFIDLDEDMDTMEPPDPPTPSETDEEEKGSPHVCHILSACRRLTRNPHYGSDPREPLVLVPPCTRRLMNIPPPDPHWTPVIPWIPFVKSVTNPQIDATRMAMSLMYAHSGPLFESRQKWQDRPFERTSTVEHTRRNNEAAQKECSGRPTQYEEVTHLRNQGEVDRQAVPDIYQGTPHIHEKAPSNITAADIQNFWKGYMRTKSKVTDGQAGPSTSECLKGKQVLRQNQCELGGLAGPFSHPIHAEYEAGMPALSTSAVNEDREHRELPGASVSVHKGVPWSHPIPENEENLTNPPTSIRPHVGQSNYPVENPPDDGGGGSFNEQAIIVKSRGLARSRPKGMGRKDRNVMESPVSDG